MPLEGHRAAAHLASSGLLDGSWFFDRRSNLICEWTTGVHSEPLTQAPTGLPDGVNELVDPLAGLPRIRDEPLDSLHPVRLPRGPFPAMERALLVSMAPRERAHGLPLIGGWLRSSSCRRQARAAGASCRLAPTQAGAERSRRQRGGRWAGLISATEPPERCTHRRTDPAPRSISSSGVHFRRRILRRTARGWSTITPTCSHDRFTIGQHRAHE